MFRLTCIALCALALGLPASAAAGARLGKSEARNVVVDVLREDAFASAHPEIDWYESFWVAPARQCTRVSSRKVDCDFFIFGPDYDDEETGELVFDYCEGSMRIRERRAGRYVWSDRLGECGTAPVEL
jgi:hypothetical protein